MRSADTDLLTAQLQEESYRRLGEAGRLRVALELSDLTHAFALAGIKRRHPEFSDADARRELAAILYGTRG